MVLSAQQPGHIVEPHLQLHLIGLRRALNEVWPTRVQGNWELELKLFFFGFLEYKKVHFEAFGSHFFTHVDQKSKGSWSEDTDMRLIS